MREILFRGKRLENGKWVYGNLVDYSPHYKWTYINYFDKHDDGFLTRFEAEVDPSTVGQYTGKNVKNGKVFDGDIGKSIDGIFLVCWDEEKSAFVIRFMEYPYETLYLEEMRNDTEIVGNIHDNPELLQDIGKREGE